MDLLPPLNAFTVFLAIAAVGFLFLMVSLFFGEIFDHFDGGLDHDLDHGGPGFFSSARDERVHHRVRRLRRDRHPLRLRPAAGVGRRVRQRRWCSAAPIYMFARVPLRPAGDAPTSARGDLVGADRPRRRRDSGRRRRPGALPGRRGTGRQDRARARRRRRSPRTRSVASKKCSAKPSSSRRR